MDNRAVLYQQIVLSGGSTMFPGMPSRIEKDLKTLYSSQILKVSPPLQQWFNGDCIGFVMICMGTFPAVMNSVIDKGPCQLLLC